MAFLKNIGGAGGPTSLLGNPLFQTGMGLLASNYDGSNPYEQITKGLLQARNYRAFQAQQAEEQRKREEAERERQRQIKLREEMQKKLAEGKNMIAAPGMIPGAPFPMPNLPKAGYQASGGLGNALGDVVLGHGTESGISQELNRRAQRQRQLDRVAIEERRRQEDKAEAERLRKLGLGNPQGDLKETEEGNLVFLTEGGKVQDSGYKARNRAIKGAGNLLWDPRRQDYVEDLSQAMGAREGLARASKTGELLAVRGEKQYEALMEARSGLTETLSGTRGLRTHDGRELATGKSGILNPLYELARGNVADFRARIKQVTGRAFLSAFDALRGGGHITEIEGLKATEAQTRLANENLSEQGFLDATYDLEYLMYRRLQRREAEMNLPQRERTVIPEYLREAKQRIDADIIAKERELPDWSRRPDSAYQDILNPQDDGLVDKWLNP